MNNRFLKHYVLLFFLAISLVGLTAQSRKATDRDEEPIPTFVDMIIVEGEAINDTASVQLITSTEIESKGIKTTAEALRAVPGVHIQTGGKGEANIFIRGFSQREVCILIDGIPLASPYDGQMDLSNIPVETIDRIEVVKGASSTMYGANTMGGVVNIITKKSNGARRVALSAQYGSGKSADMNGSIQGALGKVRYLLNGTYDTRDYYRLSGDYGTFANQGADKRDNSDKKSWSGKISLGMDIGKEGKATLNYSHVNHEKGIPHHESDPKAKYWRFNEWKDGILDFEFHNTLGNLSYKTKIYYQYFQNVLDSYDDRTYTTQKSKNAFTDTYKDFSYGGDLFFRWNLKEKHLLKGAFRYRNDTHREQANTGSIWEKSTFNLASLPLEGEWLPSSFFTLTYGTTFDFMFLDSQQGNISRTETSFNPQVAGIIHLSENLSFRLSASRKSRFPTLKELFSTTSGNINLNTMKTDIFEAGIEYRPLSKLSFTGAVFYNNVKDLINRLQKDSPYINIDKAVFKGFEIGFDWQFLSNSYLSASYTRLKSIDKTTKSQTYIQYRPGHAIDLSLMLQLPFRSALNLESNYVSSQVYYDKNNKELSLDPYTLVNVKLMKHLGNQFVLFFKINNLFDVDYYESEGYPMEGRMIYGGIQWTLN